MKKARDFLNEFLKEKDICVLALSGGPDSMCLFHLLLEQKKKKDISLICVHVDHNVRPSSKDEQEYLKKYVESYQVPIECFQIESYRKGKFTEAEGREKRYQFLKSVVQKYHANYLFTAHHADDLVETILMRMIRGSTLKGYAGLRQVSTWDDVTIVRPMLRNTKLEIKEYLAKNNIFSFQDETNELDSYMRNRIRKNIIPFLQKEEKNYPEKIWKFSETLYESNEALENLIAKEEIYEQNKIKKEEFLKYSPYLQELILRDYFHKIYGENLKLITDKHIFLAKEIIHNAKEKDERNFPQKKIFYKNKKWIWLQDKKESKPFSYELEDNLVLPDGGIIKKIKNYEQKSNYEIHLNSKQVTLPLKIVSFTPGMKMTIKNLSGTKKVSDILINAHLSKEEKRKTPILIDDSGCVLWVLGIKKSKYDLEKEENYDIIYKYIKKEGKEL